MANMLQQFEEEQINKILGDKELPKFSSGDSLLVKFKQGEREARYEGICIAKKNRGINSSFTLRKISHGEGTERTFALFSPNISSIEVIKRGKVRRAKLYYLRGRSGKDTRIAEATSGHKAKLAVKK
ncbi:50S ribosomal protein L19 [Rickettsiales bacterium LUAb2]